MIYERTYTFRTDGTCIDPDIPIHIRANGCRLRITTAQTRKGWVFGMDIRTPSFRTYVECRNREPYFLNHHQAILQGLYEAEAWFMRHTEGDIRELRTLIRRNRIDHIR